MEDKIKELVKIASISSSLNCLGWMLEADIETLGYIKNSLEKEENYNEECFSLLLISMLNYLGRDEFTEEEFTKYGNDLSLSLTMEIMRKKGMIAPKFDLDMYNFNPDSAWTLTELGEDGAK